VLILITQTIFIGDKNNNGGYKMKKNRFFTLKSKDKVITLGYCTYMNFKWNCVRIDGHTILTINRNYSLEDKRKIINEVVGQVS
jgi:hypothetical protein